MSKTKPSNKPQRASCAIPYCKNKKSPGDKNTTHQAKPLGPSANDLKRHSRKFGKLK